jgi:hypothetical protein
MMAWTGGLNVEHGSNMQPKCFGKRQWILLLWCYQNYMGVLQKVPFDRLIFEAGSLQGFR